MTSKGFKYTTEVLSMLFINFTRFINLSISSSLKIQMLCSSLSHSIFEKELKKKKKSDYELLWESWGFYRGRLCQCRPLKLCLQQSTSRSFAFFLFVFFCFLVLSVCSPTCILCLLAPQKFLLKNFLPNIIVFSICLLTF